MSAGTPPARAWLSFRRIVDIPFETCAAVLDSGQLTEPGRRAGRPLVCGPAGHDPATGTCTVQVRLGRGPLRLPLRMRLQVDQWSSAPPRTALELTPCGRVWPSAAYFRAGHLLLDYLARSLAGPGPAPRPDRPPDTDQHTPDPAPASPAAGMTAPRRAASSAAHINRPQARFMGFHEDPKGPAEAVAQVAEDAVRQHHAALGVPRGEVHRADSLTWPGHTGESRAGGGQ